MKMNCLLIEDDVMELVHELQEQLTSGVVCCKCPNPCDKSGRCAIALKNLITTTKLFEEAYVSQNVPNKEEKEVQQETEVEQEQQVK